MRFIIGYGNALRGEDAFGVDVVQALENYPLKETKLIVTFGLTPELVLELLDAEEIIFIDACYATQNHYALACGMRNIQATNLSHSIAPEVIIAMLGTLYNKHPKCEIFSMLSESFEVIQNQKLYNKRVAELVQYLKNLA